MAKSNWPQRGMRTKLRERVNALGLDDAGSRHGYRSDFYASPPHVNPPTGRRVSSACRQPSMPTPRRSHPTHKAAKSCLRPEWQRHLHRLFLVRLESDLLGQHHVARGEAALGHEAPAAEWRLQLEDVLLLSFLDEVALACVGADDFEALISRVLGELL